MLTSGPSRSETAVSIQLFARRSRNVSSAFTIIELLVVIAIIAALMAILLPSLRKARDHAKEVVCGAHLHGFATGLADYTYVNNDWLPGLNTSGVALRARKGMDGEALQESFLPVQSFDWLSPILDEPNLPVRRADRFAHLMNYYACPCAKTYNSAAYYNGSGSEKSEFEKVGSWAAVSYLMPAYFQYWGERQAGRELSPLEFFPQMKVVAKAAPDDWDNVRVTDYVSRLNRIGTPGRKVFLADGTRYLPDNLLLDHDVSPFPNYFGSFTSSGAWWRGSTAYGVHKDSLNWDGAGSGAGGSPSNGKNLALSYRHSVHSSGTGHAKDNAGLMNILFFDGHVELLNDRDSRKIEYWYPRGAVVENALEGMTAVEQEWEIP